MKHRTAKLARNALIATLLAGAQAIAILPTAHAQSAEGHPEWPGKGELFVGTCYQPVDRSPDQISPNSACSSPPIWKVDEFAQIAREFKQHCPHFIMLPATSIMRCLGIPIGDRAYGGAPRSRPITPASCVRDRRVRRESRSRASACP